WRRQQLAAIGRMLEENEQRVSKALAQDLGKPYQEVLLGETALIFSEIRHARKGLRRWARRRRVRTPLVGQPGRSWVQRAPWRGADHWRLELPDSAGARPAGCGTGRRQLRRAQAFRGGCGHIAAVRRVGATVS